MKEETRKLLEKAERALHAAECLIQTGNVEFAAGRAYYAMFHTVQALLRETDRHYRKHGSVHAAFGRSFIKSGELDAKYHRWLLDAFDERLQGDYDFEVNLDADAVARRIQQAHEFLAVARKYLEQGAL